MNGAVSSIDDIGSLTVKSFQASSRLTWSSRASTKSPFMSNISKNDGSIFLFLNARTMS